MREMGRKRQKTKRKREREKKTCTNDMEFARVTFSNLRWGTAMWVWILGMRNDEAVLLSASPGQTFLFSLYIL